MKNSDTQEIATLLEISYESWHSKAKEILQKPDSPLSFKDGVWKVSRRVELVQLLGPRVLDRDLDNFKATSIKVLKERDQSIELPEAERFAANLFNNVYGYSQQFRKGIAEGLALISNNPNAFTNASLPKVHEVGPLVVTEILNNADWIVWGSLNNLLPMLAEAAPTEFLNSVKAALRLKPCPFDRLFDQEGNGVTGVNYMSGLLWALEGLAWDPELLVSVCVLLAELASHDPGGKWANRPLNSLVTILLPWFPQTVGTIEKRKVAVQTVLAEQPEVGWNLLLQLLPGHQQTTFGSHKPAWRKTIPQEWKQSVSNKEYWDQVTTYSELAVETAGTDVARLTKLVSRLNDLVHPSFNKLLNRLRSDDITGLPEGERREIWAALVSVVRKHRKFSDEKWALPAEAVEQIEETAKVLAPKNPFDLHQYLFSERDFDLYEEKESWQEQFSKLDAKREAAIQEILTAGGMSEVIRFAEAAQSPRQVGLALGAIGDDEIDRQLLPSFLDLAAGKLRDFAYAYVGRRYSIMGWVWVNSIVRSDWTSNQKTAFLCQLPFFKDTWDRVSSWLGSEVGLYWSAVTVIPSQSGNDLVIAVAKLIEFQRPHSAIHCLYWSLQAKQSLKIDQVIRALVSAATSVEQSKSVDTYEIVELIKFLQSQSLESDDELLHIEWIYLPLLGSFGHGRPKLLEHKLATEPEFFCEVVGLVYRPKKEGVTDVKHSVTPEVKAMNAWRLLRDWKTPPGTQIDGTFSEAKFNSWLHSSKDICEKSGHLDIALSIVGRVLIHAPADANGLWINNSVASALNADDNEQMREGFRTAVYSSRGAHWVDPTGDPEKELAKEYRCKAEDIENAGYHRFADTLRSVAKGYSREAECIIADYQKRPTEED